MNKNKNSEVFAALNEIMVENIETIIAELDLDLRVYSRKVIGSCPIHGGNNNHSFNIYLDGHTNAGNWACYTHMCHNSNVFMRWNLIGFVQGVLSHQEHSWTGPGDKIVSLNDTIQYIVKILKIDLGSLKSSADPSQIDFVRFVNTFNRAEKAKATISRELVRSKLDIPAEYFLNRGFNWHILNSFDVGLCKDPKKPFYERCVVPVYEQTGQFMVGATARSIYEECQKCGEYHNPLNQCSRPGSFPKWRHSEGFRSTNYLYNSWNAFKQIAAHNDSLIIVESPGNVWKLFEAGYPNTCCIFGTDISDEQQRLIEKSGAMNLLFALDNDNAGKDSTLRAIEKLKNIFNVRSFDKFGEYNDIGVMPTPYIKESFKGYKV